MGLDSVREIKDAIKTGKVVKFKVPVDPEPELSLTAGVMLQAALIGVFGAITLVGCWLVLVKVIKVAWTISVWMWNF